MRRLIVCAVATMLIAASTAFSDAQVVPGGITPATAPSQLYVPLRDAFLATLRANATTDQKFAYASALQKAQSGDILGAQREAAQAMLTPAPLPPAVAQSLQTAIAQPYKIPGTSMTAPTPITVAPGPGVPQAVPQDNATAALAFARSEIDLGELRVGHALEDARAAYVDATAKYQSGDQTAALAEARHASDLALDAYMGTTGR
jgi:hypothetical protein